MREMMQDTVQASSRKQKRTRFERDPTRGAQCALTRRIPAPATAGLETAAPAPAPAVLRRFEYERPPPPLARTGTPRAVFGSPVGDRAARVELARPEAPSPVRLGTLVSAAVPTSSSSSSSPPGVEVKVCSTGPTFRTDWRSETETKLPGSAFEAGDDADVKGGAGKPRGHCVLVPMIVRRHPSYAPESSSSSSSSAACW